MECQQQEQTVQWYSVKSSKAKVAFYRSLGMGDKRSLFVNCSISWDGKFPGAIERVDSCFRVRLPRENYVRFTSCGMMKNDIFSGVTKKHDSPQSTKSTNVGAVL